MKYRYSFHVFYWLVTLSTVSSAQNINHTSCAQTNAVITKLYQTLATKRIENKGDRIVFIAQKLLGKPYELGALGEGRSGYFDEYPLYRTDAFDCETYVDTVLALTFGHDLPSFKRYIKKIRYEDSKVSFINRNHFTCLDWNKNNQKQQLIEDITHQIFDQQHHVIAQSAQTFIDKPNWYQHFGIGHIRLRHNTLHEQQKRLAKLKQKAKHLVKERSEVDYIPLKQLFNQNGQANMFLFKQIPQGAVIEIIRPNWDLTKKIGTNLNVSHMGFAFWKDDRLYFLQASSQDNVVVKVPLIDYLRRAQTNPTIQGINIQVAK